MTGLPNTADTNLSTFERHAVTAGATVARISGIDELVAAILALSEKEVRCSTPVHEQYPELLERLNAEGRNAITAEQMAKALRDRADLAVGLSGPVGVIVGQSGIAETGSVIVADDALGNRLVGMLSERCIILLPASAILSNLDDAGKRIAALEARGHRYVSMVTGPSRTADIERVLTIGVQGPRELHIILTEL